MIEPMQKVHIAGLRMEKEALLRVLQEQEVVHVAEVDMSSELMDEPSSTAHQLARVQFVIELLNRIRQERGIVPARAWRNFFSRKPVATVDELEQALERLGLDSLLADAQRVSDTLNDLQTREQELRTEAATLTPWQSLGLGEQALRAVGRTPVQHRLVVTTARLQPVLEEKLMGLATADWQLVSKRQLKKMTRVYLEVIVHAREAALLDQCIKEAGAESVLVDLAGRASVVEKLSAVKQELAETRQQYRQVLSQTDSLLAREQDILFTYDALLHRQERELVVNRMAQLPHTTILTGWVPVNKVELVRQGIAAAGLTAEIEAAALLPDEAPPVALRNNRVFNAFEAVTNIYGKPAYRELDPSIFLSFFFLAAFGLALTDAGYGIVLIVAMGAALKFFRLKREMRKMVKLLLYAGVSTTILGALAGGWFSINLEQLSPGSLRNALLVMKVIDPLVSPMLLLVVAFALGILQLLFAWVVRGYDHWRTGNRRAVFLDDIPWITMVVGLLAWAAAARDMGIPITSAEPLKWFVIANAAFLVLTQGRASKNPLLAVASGALSLYGLINFLSDTLSYSRLLALGLATGIIGLVVNMIAGLANEMVPIIGPLAAVGVLLVGHAFNLLINALGAFIHSGRLQFVEFFPKFIEGGGVAYKPFGRVSRYVDNPHEFE